MPFLYIFDPRPDEEYRLLGLEGVDGSLQDRQFKYLFGLGRRGSINDMLQAAGSAYVPYVTSVEATATGGSTAQLDITASAGTLYWYISTSAIPPSVANIKDGTGAASFGSYTHPGTFTGPSGLTASTTYYPYALVNDGVSDSEIYAGASFATEAADVTAPSLTSPGATVLDTTSADMTVTTDEGRGTLWAIASTVNSAPNATQIKAGQDGSGTTTNVSFAAGGGAGVNVGATGVQTITATGLTEAPHYGFFYQEDPTGNGSSVVATGAFTPADVTAPSLTSPEAALSGSYAARVQFNTDEAGTADIVFTTSATTPTATQIKAGQNHLGAAVKAGEFRENLTIAAAGHQDTTGGDLDGGTAYYAHIAQHDAAVNDADPVTSVATFTTAAAAVPGTMSAPALTVVSDTEISVDRAAAPARNGADITSYDLRHSPDESTWTTVTGITDPQSITGLTASTLYYVQTRAVNSVGAGAWSASASDTTDAGGVFTPSDLFTAEAGGWWQASDLTKLWQDSARTTQVSADGDPVGAWDTNVNSTHFLQATSGARPLYKTSAGVHWLQFDGTDDAISAAIGLGTGTWTIAASYTPGAVDALFIAAAAASSKYALVGHSGDTSTLIKDAGTTINSLYFDNVLFTGTQRGDVYTAFQGANSVILEMTTTSWPDIFMGYFNANNVKPFGNVHAFTAINKSLSATERGNLNTWQLGKAGV